MVVMVVVVVVVEQARPAAIQDLSAPHPQEELVVLVLVVLFQELLHIMLAAEVEVDIMDLMPVMAAPVVVAAEDLVVRHKELVVLMAEPMALIRLGALAAQILAAEVAEAHTLAA
jgi:hypothetical protein